MFAPSVITVSDPRLGGTITLTNDLDTYPIPGTDTGVVIWNRTWRVENEGGAWEGSAVGISFSDESRADYTVVLRGEGGYAATPNVDHIVLARTNKRLRAAYRRAALSLADGQPQLWMARLLGTPLPEKVSGSDLIWRLAAEAEQKGCRLFLYGASPIVSMQAEAKLRERFPRIQIVGRNATWWGGAVYAKYERAHWRKLKPLAEKLKSWRCKRWFHAPTWQENIECIQENGVDNS